MAKKIAFLIDTIYCDTSGTEKQLIGIITRINRKQFQPLIICLRESDWMKNNQLPCKHLVLGYRGFISLNFIRVVRELAKIIDREKIDIVQTFFEDSIFVGFLGKLLIKKKIIMISSRRDIGLGRVNQPWYHALYPIALSYVNRQFDGIVANCEKVKIYVAKREKTTKSKITVINNGVSIPERSRQIPKIIKDHKGIIWIGVLASLTPVKRHDLVIHAANEILPLAKNNRFKLVFLGDGPERSRLEKIVKDLKMDDTVIFEGSVSDVPSYLQNIDLGVLCSDREGLSNAILEYMACGLPVIATSVGGNVELVDERNGICIPKNSIPELSKSLLKLIENEPMRMKMGKASLRKINEKYSWEKSMQELERYYNSL
jgi:glycosyltransferase involved in cell wall biosynthesis